MRGKYSRKQAKLGNRNRIIRAKNIEFHLDIEKVSFVMNISYQEAFSMIVEYGYACDCSMKKAAAAVCYRFRTGLDYK